MHCNEVTTRLLAAESDAALKRHLKTCAACRLEVARVSRITQLLRHDLDRPLPTRLDHAVRTALTHLPFEARSFHAPFIAMGLAIAAALAVAISLALTFAASGAAEAGLGMALGSVVAYLALCGAIALPLFLKLDRRRSEVAE